MADSVQRDRAGKLRAFPPDQPGNSRCHIGVPRLDVDRGAPGIEGSRPPSEMHSTQISMLVPRQRAKLRGRIKAVSFHLWPAISYKVELNDDTGTVFLRITGRKSLAGFEPGRWLNVEGTPAQISGQLVLLNPFYSFLPGDF